MHNKKESIQRRKFLGNIAAGAASIGLLNIPQSIKAMPPAYFESPAPEPDEWFNKIQGKHRMIFDVTKPEGVHPFAWPRVFLISNEKTGTPVKDSSVVVVLRAEGIAYAFDDSTWSKYNFGKLFKAYDPNTTNPSIRNIFWKPAHDAFNIPGIGNVLIGINDLQDDGVMFCVCDMAITVHSAVTAKTLNKDAAEVKKDWLAGLLPGIQVVPSGVWAVGRAQEHDCKYCYV